MILHTQVTLDRSYGGPARTVPALCDGLTNYADTALLSTITDAETDALFKQTSFTLYRAKSRSFRDFTDVLHRVNKIELIHDHGIWLPANMAAYRHATRHGLPLVVSTRGMLVPWALKQKWLKKKLAWHMYQKKILNYASVLHATAESEVEACRGLGFTQPIAVIPNGVEFPASLPEKQANHRKTILFISRFHPGKGLSSLLTVWKDLQNDDWQIVIAGPDENGHQATLEKQIVDLNLQSVSFTGNLSDDEKWQAYANADLFVLPTLSENFGVVVAEALAAGLPVITTKGAPWQLLEEEKCGWWIEIGVDPLRAALQEAMALSTTQREEMGKRGKEVCYERFSWNNIAQEMSRVYQHLLTGSEKPDCLV
jgi:glycosyltransferase involved in cell wall biosynthesis